jgi:hypothetical protein
VARHAEKPAGLVFRGRFASSCNPGDSRQYRDGDTASICRRQLFGLSWGHAAISGVGVRVLRSILGVLLGLLGLIIAAVGGAAAFWLIGPDDTVYSKPQHLTSKGPAIASYPKLLDHHGPVLHVDATRADGKPVFVGVGRDLDVASYLKGVAHTSLVQIKYPIALTTEEIKAEGSQLTAPDTLDWWVTKATGAGTQAMTWPITDGPYDVVIMSADGKTPPDVQIRLGIELANAFAACLVVFVIGLVLLAAGIFLIIFRHRPRPPAAQTAVQTSGQAMPQQQQQPTAGPLRRVATVGVAVALVSGCSAIPQPNTVESLTRPAIGNETAVAVIKHYNEVNNTANKTRDDKLIATIEGGDLLRQSQAAYLISRVLDKPGKKLPEPFTYTKPVIGAPDYGSYPMRFVASAGVSTSKDHGYLGVWERKAAGSPWLLTFAAGPKTTVKLPELSGLRPVAAADTAKLVAAPQAAATTLAEYLTVGAKSPRAATFAPSPEVSTLLKEVVTSKAEAARQPKLFRGVSWVNTVSTPPTAFMTTSGAALAFVTLNEEYVLTAQPDAWLNWATGDTLAFSPATVRHDNAVTKTTLHDVALLIPAKGGGKVQVLAFEAQVVGAGGY